MRVHDSALLQLKSQFLVSAIAAASQLLFLTCEPTQAAGVLPTGGRYVAGAGRISTSAGELAVDQSSTTGIIDWTGFSIGKNKAVAIDNGSGATLNRVTGTDETSIAGTLHSTGSVYLINPEGVVITASGRVLTTGNFFASTRDTDDDAFIDGDPLRFLGRGRGNAVNRGRIVSSGGTVALIGSDARNAGTISAKNGEVDLAAADRVTFETAAGHGALRLGGDADDVSNSGTIRAAQAELASAGGNVETVDDTGGGIIHAVGTKTINGHVWLIAEGGRVGLSGEISAQNADGSGGSIGTSGSRGLSFSGATVTAKHWLVDPQNLTITAAAASTIDSSLNNNTNVTLKTTSSGASGPGTKSSGPGDILVDAAIAWKSDATLAIDAFHNIDVKHAITNTGAGYLSLRADDAGRGKGNILFATGGKVNFAKSTGYFDLYYNPSDNPAGSAINTTSYTQPTNFTKDVVLNTAVTSQYEAFMLVNTVFDLQNVENNLSGDYALGKNINAAVTKSWNPNSGNTAFGGFVPIAWQGNTTFTGLFDGLGYTISNLYENWSGNGAFGLFGVIGQGAAVGNFNLTDVTLDIGQSLFAGAVAGQNYGTLTNVVVSGTMTSSLDGPLGGLVGENESSGEIDNARANVVVDDVATSQGTMAGGLVGQNYGLIESSHATGAVIDKADSANVGGLAGVNNGLEGAGYIFTSSASGKVTGGTSAEGGGADVGGLVGYNVSSNGAKDGTSKNTAGTIYDSYASGEVVDAGALEFIGGLVGENQGNVLKDWATGAVSGGTDALTGGLIGDNSQDTGSGIVIETYASGNVTGGKGDEAGGLVGSNSSLIAQSYATGNVVDGSAAVGSTDVVPRAAESGGLVGLNQGTVEQSYAWGTVTVGATTSKSEGAIAYGGGLIGNDYGGAVDQSFSIGKVTGGKGSLLGGLMGGGGESVTESYWDTTTSGLTTTAAHEGKGLTDAQLKSGALPAGFSSSIWVATAGEYPTLKWQ